MCREPATLMQKQLQTQTRFLCLLVYVVNDILVAQSYPVHLEQIENFLKKIHLLVMEQLKVLFDGLSSSTLEQMRI